MSEEIVYGIPQEGEEKIAMYQKLIDLIPNSWENLSGRLDAPEDMEEKVAEGTYMSIDGSYGGDSMLMHKDRLEANENELSKDSGEPDILGVFFGDKLPFWVGFHEIGVGSTRAPGMNQAKEIAKYLVGQGYQPGLSVEDTKHKDCSQRNYYQIEGQASRISEGRKNTVELEVEQPNEEVEELRKELMVLDLEKLD